MIGNPYKYISIIYDYIVEPFLSIPRQVTAEIFSRRFDNPGRVRILEVAGGTGMQATWLAKRGFAVYLLEKAPGMIRRAIRKARLLKTGRLSVVRGDAAEIPLPAARFDGIIIQMTLHEMNHDTRRRCISEMKRIAKHGATFLFLDFVPAPRLTFASLLILVAERVAGHAHYRNGRQFVKNGGLIQFLRCNGFQVVRSFSFLQDHISLTIAIAEDP